VVANVPSARKVPLLLASIGTLMCDAGAGPYKTASRANRNPLVPLPSPCRIGLYTATDSLEHIVVAYAPSSWNMLAPPASIGTTMGGARNFC
jgi:hypothetical protein